MADQIKHGGADSRASTKLVRKSDYVAFILEDLLDAVLRITEGEAVDGQALYNQCRADLEAMRKAR